MHTLPRTVALLAAVVALSACSAPTQTPVPAATTAPSITTSAVTPTPAVDQTKAQLRATGEVLFGTSWRPESLVTWPEKAGELGLRVGLCARAWAKNPKDPITVEDVEASKSSLQGTPREVCVEGGSMQLVVVAASLQSAINAGIPDPDLAAEATQLLADGGKTGLVAVSERFTKHCAPFSSMTFPAEWAACKAPAKAMVPVLDRYNKLEADWAAAIA